MDKMLDIIIEYGPYAAALIGAVVVPILKKLTKESAARNMETLATSITHVVGAAKTAKGLKGADVNALAADVTKAAIPTLTKVLNPSIVAKTMEAVNAAHYAAGIVRAEEYPTLSLSAEATGKELGGALKAELKRATIEARATGIPGRGIDAAKVSAGVTLKLGNRKRRR